MSDKASYTSGLFSVIYHYFFPINDTPESQPSFTPAPSPLSTPKPEPTKPAPKRITGYNDLQTLHTAAKEGDLKTIQSFIDNGFTFKGTPYYKNPVQEALMHNQFEAVKLLLSNGAELRTHFLTDATKHCDAKMVQLLIEHNIDVNTYDPNVKNNPLVNALDTSALFNALLKGDQSMVDSLLAAHADPLLSLKPIHIAAAKGDMASLTELLASGANIQETDNLGIKPIYYATALNHAEVVELLIQQGADPNEHFDVLDQKDQFQKTDFQQTTLLHVAAYNNAANTLATLLKHHVPIDQVNNTYMSPIGLAVKFGHDASIEVLLKHGADAFRYGGGFNQLSSHYQNMALENICEYKKNAYREQYPKPEEHTFKYYNHEHNHTRYYLTNESEQLLKAVIKGDIQEIESLYAKNNRLEITSPLYLSEAILHDQTETAKFLVSMGAKFEDRFSRQTYVLPLHAAAQYNNIEMINLMISKGANVNTLNNSGVAPLIYAIKNKHFDAAKVLIDKGADINHISSKGFSYSESSPLLTAIETGDLNFIHYLKDQGAVLEHEQSLYYQKLKEALWRDDFHVFKLLAEHGADVHFMPNDIPLLTIATREENIEAIHYLIEQGINVTTYDPHMKPSYMDSSTKIESAFMSSALFNAIIDRQVDTMHILQKQGVDQNLGLTSIDLAIINDDKAAFDALVSQNPQAALEADALGIKPIYFAALYAREEMLGQLLDLGADVNESLDLNPARDYFLLPPSTLMAAVDSGSIPTVEKLLHYGANLNEEAISSETPLSASLEDLSMSQFLVDAGADVLHRDKYGNFVFAHLYGDDKQAIKDVLLSKICPKQDTPTLVTTDIISTHPQAIVGLENAPSAQTVNTVTDASNLLQPLAILEQPHLQAVEHF